MRGWLRALRIELRRGICPLIFATTALASLAFVWTGANDWGAHWEELSQWMRTILVILAPMTATLGAWQAGRDHRRATTELLSTTARSTLTRLSAMTIATALAATAGMTLAWASAAVTVWRTATFFSTDAIWLLLSAIPYLLAAAAIGTVFGHLVPLRIIAPLVGSGLYLVFAIPSYTSSPFRVLNGIEWIDDEYWMLDHLLILAICAFAAGMALVALGVASSERRPASYQTGWYTAAIGLIIVAVAAPAAAARYPDDTGPHHGLQARDLAAHQLVCTTDDGPRVCVYAPDAPALEDITPSARQDLERLAGLDGAPTWAAPALDEGTARPQAMTIYVGSLTPWGNVAHRDDDQSATSVFYPRTYCPEYSDPDAGVVDSEAIDEQWFAREQVARWWLYGDDGYIDLQDPLLQRFQNSTPQQQRAWLEQVMAAAKACDADRLLDADDVLVTQ